MGGQLLAHQLAIRFFPDFGGGSFVEQFIDTEKTLQLEMSPLIQRIAQRVRNGSCPSQELLVRICTAGAVMLGSSIGSHGPPLVMVSFQPDFKEVGEAPILRDLLHREMAVVVIDR